MATLSIALAKAQHQTAKQTDETVQRQYDTALAAMEMDRKQQEMTQRQCQTLEGGIVTNRLQIVRRPPAFCGPGNAEFRG